MLIPKKKANPGRHRKRNMDNAMEVEPDEEGITLFPSDFVKIERIEENGEEVPEK